MKLEPPPRSGDLGFSGCVGAACSGLGALAPADRRLRRSCLTPVLSLCCLALRCQVTEGRHWAPCHPYTSPGRRAEQAGTLPSIHSFIGQTEHLTTPVSSQVLTLRSREMALKRGTT